MLVIIVAASVALASFIVYALERRSKAEPIVWEDAIKIGLFGGIVSAGIVFVSVGAPESVVATAAAAAVVSETAQDMFVGTPSF